MKGRESAKVLRPVFRERTLTMPIFEYICKDCKKPFEVLIMGSRQAACPSCHGRNLAQQFSVFAPGAPRTGAPATAACGASPSTCGLARGPGGCCME
jgi:putative FmdB family regulatory protein